MPRGIYQHKPNTEEHNKHIGEAHKGKSKSSKGKHYPKMSEAGKKMIGEKNNCWKGGCERYLRKLVLIRDDYTCQVCGLREPAIMEVDHILPKSKYPDLVKSLDNMVTLCPNCHRKKSNREKSLGEK